jgi:hypothetical protein
MRLALFILLGCIIIPSCKKYDEGPSLSILGKQQRLTGKWELTSFFLNENEINITNKTDLTINKNGTFSTSILIGTNTFSNNGNWTFSDKKESLLLTYSAQNTEDWTIKRLSNKQLFIEMTISSGSKVRYEYVKKVKQ